MKSHSLDWFKNQHHGFSGQLSFDEPLSKHTYYRIGGPAQIFAMPKSQQDLNWLAQGIQDSGIPFFMMGQGSNLLVSDQGFPGLVIRANKLNLEMHYDPETARLRTGASVVISSLLRKASQEGWAGLEFLTGIPGSVGGAVFMNAGTHLGETQSRLRKTKVFDFDTQSWIVFEEERLQFQYRKNLFLPKHGIVWDAEWQVDLRDPTSVKQLIDETLSRRKATQPIDYPSCGSVFKNPKSVGKSAWQVVDQLGLRGHRIGNAQFSEKHSNFIINLGNAKAVHVKGLIDLAKSRAFNELGIQLEEEVIYLSL